MYVCNYWTRALFSLQIMHFLAPLVLVVVCGATATVGRTYCSREDADIAIDQWTQAFGIGGNVDPRVTIRETTRLFVAYVVIIDALI